MEKKINFVDICCGLNWGDEAKGKIISQLAKSGEYDFVCRWAGGNNAGHTIYKNGKKYKTLRITMKNPLVNGKKSDSWKRHIRWLDTDNGRIVKEEFKDTGWNLEFIRSIND